MTVFTRIAVRIAWRVRALALVFVPRRVRTAYGDEMTATFADAIEQARDRGAGAVAAVLRRELVDLLHSRRADRPAGLDAGPSGSGGAFRLVAPSGWIQAWRALRHRPAFLAASVPTLAVSTGLLITVFALVDTVVLKPLPYPASEQLVTLYESSPAARDRTSLVAPARLSDWLARSRAFTAVSGSYGENVTDTSGAEPERLEGRRVLPRFFDVFAMPPVVGRTFSADEERFGGPGAVVISEGLWTRRFARDPRVVEHALTIGGRSYAIVGVIPAAFTTAATDVWLPAQLSPALMSVREARFVGGIGRLRDDADHAAGARDLAAVQDALAREYPATDAGWSVQLTALKDARVGTAGRGVVLLFGAVGTLWAIALANVIALMLIHVQQRRRELAVRSALGASRLHVVGTLAREAALVCAAGATLGFLIALWLTSLLPVFLPDVPRIGELVLDWRGAVFGGTLLLVACAAVTLIPMVHHLRRDHFVTASGRTIAPGHHFAQRAMVVLQVALSVVLLGTSTLLARGYFASSRADIGFDPVGVIAFHVGARWDEDRARVGRFQQELLARLEELPHVSAAGLTNFLPATGATLRYRVRVDGVGGANSDGTATVGARMIGGQYLQALAAPLIAGTSCAPARPGAIPRREALVNQRFVDEHAPGAAIVGRQLSIAQGGMEPFRIAGVVGNIAEDGPGTHAFPYVYTCDPPGSWPDPEYVVRTTHPGAFVSDLRRITRELDPERAVFGVRAATDVLDAALERPRFDAAAVGVFAVVALALAATGLYSLLSLIVAGSRRAIAVRIALGASARDVVAGLLIRAGTLCAGGLVLGCGLSVLADRALQTWITGLRSTDVASLATAAGVLAFVALLALLGPARRAVRTSPVEALRGD